MADDEKTTQNVPAERPTPSSSSSAQVQTTSPPPADTPSDVPPATAQATGTMQSRTELIQQARSFLSSSQTRSANVGAKRTFLMDKGLTSTEIDALLREHPQIPTVPPPTYPQPPPSQLPQLLLGLARAIAWFAGGSAILLLLYNRFLLPRLTRSKHARESLEAHHRDLLNRLTKSVQETKDLQSKSFDAIPRSSIPSESKTFRDLQSFDELAAVLSGPENAEKSPNVTLLRCAIHELEKEKCAATAEEISGYLQNKMTWIPAEEWSDVQHRLWTTLSTHPSFTSSESDSPVWTYIQPPPVPAPPIVASLSSLVASLPKYPPANSPKIGPMQRTLQALSDLTGYITTQTYAAHTFRTPGIAGFGGMGTGSGMLSPQEEEVRKEIRALKGLVLNRRSFMPNAGRPTTPGIQSVASTYSS